MGLPRFKNGLLPNNAFAFYFALVESGVVNVPVTTQQLDRILTAILNRDTVREYIMVLAGTGIRGLVFRLHGDFDPVCNFRNHTHSKISIFWNSLNEHILLPGSACFLAFFAQKIFVIKGFRVMKTALNTGRRVLTQVRNSQGVCRLYVCNDSCESCMQLIRILYATYIDLY